MSMEECIFGCVAMICGTVVFINDDKIRRVYLPTLPKVVS